MVNRSRNKRTAPSPLPEAQDVIDIDDDNNLNQVSQESKKPLKRSWVWTHFDDNKSGVAVCQVIKRDGTLCAKRIKKDASGSTKNFHGHLLSIHRLVDPSLAKKTKKVQMLDLEKWAKSGTIKTKVPLNNDSIKNAVVYMEILGEFVQLLNKDAWPLFRNVCRSGIATHAARMFLQSQETIELDYLAKQTLISFTQDAWSAPNVTAYMAVTAHFIDESFTMRDLTLGVPCVQGSHTGKNFADLFHNVLKK
ncbi:hypothetical protein PSTG_17237 [Puccinia striiformis f. sp. tritici PST-78]|uniref:BED-type domain-containing protein n=1 Tax=Puccinia striiformis f. sp. tritici PST-78 TaxID=1165861 RepID=A0A0L0UQI6_9BASI|nr:hypothetical protein PSTG_17237 [Puccinia striiformis f. sp. tritici PST-78]